MRVSIITTCLDRMGLIGEAIDSAHGQPGVELEHIVIDGGSTDGTLEFLARHPHLRVVSEPDHGPEEALNKGIALATGEVMGFLMSDDRLGEGILGAVAERFDADSGLDIASCGAEVFETTEGGAERTLIEFQGAAAALSWRNVLLGSPIACARFYRHRLFERLGPFRTDYRWCADREFLLRALLAGVREAGLDRIGYRYRQHGGSRSLGAPAPLRRAIAEEHLRLAKDTLSRPGLSREARRWLLRFHAVESARAMAAAVAANEPGAALSFLGPALRAHPAFPFIAAAQIVALRRQHRKGV
jgi:glycosyltransferase involved in cell wall biosynthesis